jgi:hypothetical protein
MDEELKTIAEDDWLVRISHYVPSAWLGHAPFLRYLIREMEPKVFVELGTHNGFSYFVACQTIVELGLPTQAFAVDHWHGDKHAGVFDESVYSAVVELNKHYNHFSNLLKMSFYEARSSVPDGIDLLHVDGLHTYEAVKEDFETWLPKMNPDGIILLHDIHVRHGDFGVYRLWAELKSQYKTIEFTGSYGLGIVFLGAMPSENIAFLRDISESGHSVQSHGVFGALGDVVIQKYHSLTKVELKEIKVELKEIKDSRSWRITAPLRKLFSIATLLKK